MERKVYDRWNKGENVCCWNSENIRGLIEYASIKLRKDRSRFDRWFGALICIRHPLPYHLILPQPNQGGRKRQICHAQVPLLYSRSKNSSGNLHVIKTTPKWKQKSKRNAIIGTTVTKPHLKSVQSRLVKSGLSLFHHLLTNSSGPAHRSKSDPRFHATVAMYKRNNRFVTTRHIPIGKKWKMIFVHVSSFLLS